LILLLGVESGDSSALLAPKSGEKNLKLSKASSPNYFSMKGERMS